MIDAGFLDSEYNGSSGEYSDSDGESEFDANDDNHNQLNLQCKNSTLQKELSISITTFASISLHTEHKQLNDNNSNDRTLTRCNPCSGFKQTLHMNVKMCFRWNQAVKCIYKKYIYIQHYQQNDQAKNAKETNKVIVHSTKRLLNIMLLDSP